MSYPPVMSQANLSTASWAVPPHNIHYTDVPPNVLQRTFKNLREIEQLEAPSQEVATTQTFFGTVFAAATLHLLFRTYRFSPFPPDEAICYPAASEALTTSLKRSEELANKTFAPRECLNRFDHFH